MLSNNIFYIFLLLIPIFQISALEKVKKRLSPIQINSDQAEVLSKDHLERSSNKPVDLKGKVIKSAASSKPKSLAEDAEYDSLDDIQYIDEENHDSPVVRGKKNIKQWDHWGKWSECSVTCGVGKMTRWRHCVTPGCASGEKEAQIKICSEKRCP